MIWTYMDNHITAYICKYSVNSPTFVLTHFLACFLRSLRYRLIGAQHEGLLCIKHFKHLVYVLYFGILGAHVLREHFDFDFTLLPLFYLNSETYYFQTI
jgi:hypothetical protein